MSENLEGIHEIAHRYNMKHGIAKPGVHAVLIPADLSNSTRLIEFWHLVETGDFKVKYEKNTVYIALE